jgi:peptide/nickel transport system substrate-binding protein
VEQGQTANTKARRQIVYQMQQMVFDDRPYVVLVYNDTINAWSTHWDGFVESSQGLFGALTKASLIAVHQV